MNRRRFLLSAVALGLFGCAPSATEAAPFQPTRFSVQVQGSGHMVLPGEVRCLSVAGMNGLRWRSFVPELAM